MDLIRCYILLNVQLRHISLLNTVIHWHTFRPAGRPPVWVVFATFAAVKGHRMTLEIVHLLDNRCCTSTRHLRDWVATFIL